MSLEPIVSAIKRIQSRLDRSPRFVWASVVSTDPLTVWVDGDEQPLAATPALASLTPRVGSRVYCVMQNGRCTVVGVSGSAATPFAMAGGSVNTGENPAPGERTTVNISFPAGRFTVPPLMSFNGLDTYGGAVISSDGITTSGARIVVGRPLAAYGWSNGTVQWTAVQMTPTSAGG